MNTTYKKDTLKQFGAIYSWSIKRHLRDSVTYLVSLAIFIFSGILYEATLKLGYGTFFSMQGLLGISLVFTLIFAKKMFSYMYNKRSVDLFNSLPVTRTTMLLGRYFAGLTLLVTPIILVSIPASAILSSISNSTLKTLIGISGCSIFSVIAAFTFSTFIAVCTGNVKTMIASIIGINFIYPIFIFLCYLLAGTIIPGYSITNHIPLIIHATFCPFLSFIAGPGSTVPFLIWFILFCSILLFLAIILNKKRKSETAESNFAFRALKIILNCFISLAFGLVIGIIVSFFSVSHISIISAIIIVSFIIYLLFYLKEWKKLKKDIKYHFITLAVFFAFYTTLCFGFFGYDTRTPNINDIESITLDLTTVNYENIGSTVTTEFPADDEHITIGNLSSNLTEQQSINDVLDLHNSIISNLHSKNYPYSPSRNFTPNFVITYNLKNGSKLKRNYYTSSLDETNLKKLTEIVHLP